MEMEGQTILQKTTKTGGVMFVQTEDGQQVVVYLDGKIVMRDRSIPCRLDRSPTGMPEITHHLGKVGLTAAEATQVKVGMQAVYQEWCETYPIEEPDYSLPQQRQLLVDRVNGLWQDAEATYWRLHAQERVDAWARKAKIECQAKNAQKDLAAFDAAHPEVIAGIKARRAEDAERFARTD